MKPSGRSGLTSRNGFGGRCCCAIVRSRCANRRQTGATRDQEVQKHSQAVDLRRRRAGAPGKDLRSDVEWRAGEVAAARRLTIQLPAGSEIHEDGSTTLLAHHVVRLDVAMKDVGAVHRCQRATQVDADDRRLVRAERCLTPHDFVERLALDELHRQADLVVDHAPRHRRDDVGMLHLDQAPRFVECLFLIDGEPGMRERMTLSATSSRRVGSMAR